MTRWLCLLTVLTAWSPRVLLADPQPVQTEYLRTFTGGFQFSAQKQNWAMFIIVQPLKQSPVGGPLYLEAIFENPQRNQPQLVQSKSSRDGNEMGVELKVLPVSGMRDRKGYEVTVRSYADAKHTKLLGVHKQTILYHDVGDPNAFLRKARGH